ncbi:response regulator transcription factor [Parablautia sp. Marseille-Q6255]|uniref:response regulator transcription factor n=1 Tax=Parablautia sp. Marseille-Q6255 TaxID=3039593 RepID=UPI0024BBFF98|nr:response regulator [Parablautia sp. Marseille-Q6255]
MKLLVVDDEDFTRKCVSEQMDWNSYDIEVVGTAIDGIDAWEKICVLNPDFVIVDIKMPRLNGLELLEKIENARLDIDTVILSGFDEFEFAQKALNLGAKNYLLKPVDLSELLNIIIMLQEKRIQKRESLENVNGFENVIRNLIYMEYTPEQLDKIYERVKKVWNNWQAVLLLQMEDISEALYIGASSIYKNLLQKIKEYCSLHTESYLLEKCPQNIMIYFLAEEKEDIGKLTDELIEIVQNTLLRANYSNYTVGVSATNYTVEESGKSFLEASRALNMKFIYGSGRVYYTNSDFSYAEPESLALNKMIQKIIEYTVYYNEQSIDYLLEQFYEEAQKRKIDCDYMRQATYLILVGIIRHEALVNIDIASLYSNTGAVIMDFCSCDDKEKMWEKLKSFLHTIGRQLNKVKIKKPNQTVVCIEQYIKEHYAQTDLSLSRIAEAFSFSPAYISTLFKNNCRQTITDYINTVRVEAACRMLRDEYFKVSSISDQVGYSNTTYFNKVFKKLKGCSPRDYREQWNG